MKKRVIHFYEDGPVTSIADAENVELCYRGKNVASANICPCGKPECGTVGVRTPFDEKSKLTFDEAKAFVSDPANFPANGKLPFAELFGAALDSHRELNQLYGAEVRAQREADLEKSGEFIGKILGTIADGLKSSAAPAAPTTTPAT